MANSDFRRLVSQDVAEVIIRGHTITRRLILFIIENYEKADFGLIKVKRVPTAFGIKITLLEGRVLIN